MNLSTKKWLKQLVKSVLNSSLDLVGLEIRRKSLRGGQLELLDGSLVVPRVWDQPYFKDLLASRLEYSRHPLVLLGSITEIDFLQSGFAWREREVTGIEWTWESGTNLPGLPEQAQIIVCKLPVNEYHWRIIKQLKENYGSRVIGIQELVLPFTTILEAQTSFEYAVKTLAEIAPFYLGKEYFNSPLDELNARVPLKGKRVIEFGPMDGAQTAGLVHLGVQSVTCIEARAASLIKTMIACYCFGWDNVKIIMDDFHNADSRKYGEFDLAFAHGVYYHSIAPFLFFENLMSLSDNIYIGGYCTAESASPIRPNSLEYTIDTLEYEGKEYRVQKIKIGNSYNSAVNLHAYHFDRNDLLNFFRDRGYQVDILWDAPLPGAWGAWGEWFLRFLARKTDSVKSSGGFATSASGMSV